MKFLDEAKIYLKSGNGGDGCTGFRREKFVEFGGPNGGDGGRGGDVVIQAADGLNTLIDFRYQQHFKAKRGENGKGRDMTGASAPSLIIKVPAGTQVLDEEKDRILADLTAVGQSVRLLQGGDGGFGNTHFKTATNRAPRRSDPGWPGEECWVWLRLKLIADAGLVGLPNAGKSTFLGAVSRARPKVGAYPFTTLHPSLGVVTYDDREFVMADIPGLIEGAHEGVGLGDRFLGHIERCGILLHLIDGIQDDPLDAYRTIRKELEAYGGGLADKPQIIGLNKCDSLADEDTARISQALSKESGSRVMCLSAILGDGVKEIVQSLLRHIDQDQLEREEAETASQGYQP